MVGAMFERASFSCDPSMLLMPRIRNLIAEQARGISYTLQPEWNGLLVTAGRHSIKINRAQLVECMARDAYDAIDGAVIGAMRYLKALIRGNNSEKSRQFRSKRRSILVRRRYGY